MSDPYVHRAVALGVVVAALLVAVAAVPLPGALLWVGVAAYLVSGVALGAFVGRVAGERWRTRRRAGLAVGTALGVGVAVALLATMTLVARHPDRSVLYGLHYLLAASGVLPSRFVARYDLAVAVGYASTVGGVLAAETVVGAVAVPGVPASPSPDR